MTTSAPLAVGQTLTGPLFNEPMRVETVAPGGPGSWVVGLVGTQTERFRRVTLSESDLATLAILEPTSSYDGDGNLLRLGIQAYSLGIAHEFDPYFGLSISKVDPLAETYRATPDRLYVVGRDGRIAYRGGPGPFGFNPIEMEQTMLLMVLEEKDATRKSE